MSDEIPGINVFLDINGNLFIEVWANVNQCTATSSDCNTKDDVLLKVAPRTKYTTEFSFYVGDQWIRGNSSTLSFNFVEIWIKNISDEILSCSLSSVQL